MLDQPQIPYPILTTTEIPQLTILFDAETGRELVLAVERAAADKALELGLKIITAVYPVTTIDNLEELLSHEDANTSPTPADPA